MENEKIEIKCSILDLKLIIAVFGDFLISKGFDRDRVKKICLEFYEYFISQEKKW